MSNYLTTHEVAHLCRTSPETVRYWNHIGKGPRSIKVGKKRLYEESDVRAWLDALKAEQGEADAVREEAVRHTEDRTARGTGRGDKAAARAPARSGSKDSLLSGSARGGA